MSLELNSANAIKSIIESIEAVTGESHYDLTSAVQALKNGYGQGGGDERIRALLSGTITEITADDLADTTAIKSYQFSDLSSIKSVVIPDNVTSIGSAAFSGCTGIERLRMPISVNVGSGIFTGVSNIKTLELGPGTGAGVDYSYDTHKYTPWYLSTANMTAITLLDGITKIGKYTFYECTGLTDIVIPSGVTIINTYAFGGCTGLKTVFIPKTTTSINLGAFHLCSTITDVYYEGTEQEWARISISSTGNEYLTGATIHYNSTGLPEE